MALQWTPMQLPLSNGLQQKYDARSRPMPALDICRDAQFDDLGGLQTRYPFSAMSNSIFGGGTLSSCRRLAADGDELLVFTDTAIYSWNAQLSKWVLKGTHLAVGLDEQTRFATTDDQIDSDRAELSGTVVYAWLGGTTIYVAALDKTTGSVLMTPTAVGGATNVRPRLVALSTKILLFWNDGANSLMAIAIDPASPATALAGASTTLLSGSANLFYDAVRVGVTDTAVVASRRVVTTSYDIFTVTAALAVPSSATKARTCDGPIAVSADPNGNMQVIRANGTNIQGDRLSSVLVDVIVNQAVGTAAGTPVNQIAAAHQSVLNGGQFRCYVFWSAQESATNSVAFQIKSNFVDTGGTIGTQAAFLSWCGVGSRAFDYAGRVYFWATFGQTTGVGAGAAIASSTGQLQNAYYLYRDDGFLCAKSTYSTGGGLAPTTGRLPGVALTTTATYAWAATKRRIIELGSGNASGATRPSAGYSARAPNDVTLTFDSNEARRTAPLGNALYVAAGEILQYDGVQLVETGFHIYPWFLDALVSGPGSIANGSYAYKQTARWQSAKGDEDRSTTAIVANVTMTGGPSGFSVQGVSVPITHKTTNAPAIEIWRTVTGPSADAPFYLVTSLDPAVTANPNRYIANGGPTGGFPATILDAFSDATASAKQTNPENGAVLEALAPPAATIIVATDTRIFLAGVAGDPDRVWYSRQRNAGEVASFNDTLTFDVPRIGGRITALDFLNDTLIVFRETAVYAFGGDGFDNTGGGQNYGPARTVVSDVGAVSQEAVVLGPMGIVFKSSKGWHLLDVGWGAKFIGDKVSSFDTDTVLSMHVVESQHQIRILTNARMVVWDYFANQWGEWTVSDGLHSVIWQGTHVYLTATGPKQQLSTYTGLTYGMDAELTWIKPADLQGAVAVRWFELLGEYRSSCRVRMRVARDYQYDGAGNVAYFDDFSWSPSPTTVGSALQVRHSPSAQKVEAFKVRITAAAQGSAAALDCSTMNVLTSGAVWNATWLATALGNSGNAVTMTIAFEDGSPFSIDVRSHFAWSHTLQRWQEDLNNVGVRVLCRTGSSPTVLQLETAIAAATTLIEADTPDTTPTKIINASAMVNLTRTGTFAGGSYGTPTGEAIKLTGLGLEVGAQQGLYRRLPAAQKA